MFVDEGRMMWVHTAKLGGEWKIIHKAFHRVPKSGAAAK